MTNTVNVNPEQLTEQKLAELRQVMVDFGIKLIDASRSKHLGNRDALVSVAGSVVQCDADIKCLLAQLTMLDEMTRPVGSRGQHVHVEDVGEMVR